MRVLNEEQIEFLLKEVKAHNFDFPDCKCEDVDKEYMCTFAKSNIGFIYEWANGIYWAEDDLSEAGDPRYNKAREDMAWSIIKRDDYDDYEEDDDYDGIGMNTPTT